MSKPAGSAPASAGPRCRLRRDGACGAGRHLSAARRRRRAAGEAPSRRASGRRLPGRQIASRRARRPSSQFVNSANTQKIPEWARLDAGARYTARFYDTNVTFRANVNNLLDHNYWAGSYFVDGIVILSSPRTVLVSATVDF